MIRTFAPLAMHWSACVFCFCGSPCALTTRAETPAALNALMSDGWSNSSQRTDVFVSGIRPQTCTPAAFLPELAPAPVAMSVARALTAKSRTIDLLEIFFTANLLLLRGWISPASAQGPEPRRDTPGGSSQRSRIRDPTSRGV